MDQRLDSSSSVRLLAGIDPYSALAVTGLFNARFMFIGVSAKVDTPPVSVPSLALTARVPTWKLGTSIAAASSDFTIALDFCLFKSLSSFPRNAKNWYSLYMAILAEFESVYHIKNIK